MQQQMPDAGHTREAEQVGPPPTIVALPTLTARQNQPVLGDATKIRCSANFQPLTPHTFNFHVNRSFLLCNDLTGLRY